MASSHGQLNILLAQAQSFQNSMGDDLDWELETLPNKSNIAPMKEPKATRPSHVPTHPKSKKPLWLQTTPDTEMDNLIIDLGEITPVKSKSIKLFPHTEARPLFQEDGSKIILTQRIPRNPFA